MLLPLPRMLATHFHHSTLRPRFVLVSQCSSVAALSSEIPNTLSFDCCEGDILSDFCKTLYPERAAEPSRDAIGEAIPCVFTMLHRCTVAVDVWPGLGSQSRICHQDESVMKCTGHQDEPVYMKCQGLDVQMTSKTEAGASCAGCQRGTQNASTQIRSGGCHQLSAFLSTSAVCRWW